jgi:YfiH family protein
MPLPPVSDSFYWADEPWGPSLHCRPLDRVASHLFSTRNLELRLGLRSPGWSALATSFGVNASGVVRIHQVHGCAVVSVLAEEQAPAMATTPEADAIVSNDPARVVTVQSADCVPVLLADPVTGTVGAVHAGWRGTAARAVRAAVDAMRRLGARPADLVAAIGPSIGPCCYEVGEELVDAFAAARHPATDLERWFIRSVAGKPRLDLPSANRDQLVAAGLRPDRVHPCGLCTASNLDVLYSFRAEGPSTGRLVAAIRCRPQLPSVRA